MSVWEILPRKGDKDEGKKSRTSNINSLKSGFGRIYKMLEDYHGKSKLETHSRKGNVAAAHVTHYVLLRTSVKLVMKLVEKVVLIGPLRL